MQRRQAGFRARQGSESVSDSEHRRGSIFSQRLDRTTFTAYLLGAVVPLTALAVVVQRYAIPAISDNAQLYALVGGVGSIAVLSLLSFLVLRKVTRSTLERIDRDNRRLAALLGTSTTLTASEHTSEIAATAVACALELTGAQASFLLVRGKDPAASAELFESAGRDCDKLFRSLGSQLAELAGLAMSNGRPAIKQPSATSACILVLPLSGESAWLGALAAVHARPGASFERAQVDGFTTLAGLTSVAMRNADLRDAQRNFFSHMTEILVSALDAHLDYHDGHGNRVAQYANRVGRALKLDDKRLQHLHFASLLHDVGMLKIERSAHRSEKACAKHAELGFRMLARIRLWEDVAPIVHCHHEWYDGSGYPQGLAGEDIPLESRIITVCDAFDSMTSNTSYKVAMPLEAAVEEVRTGMGTQFDPRVAQTFLDLVTAGVISTG